MIDFHVIIHPTHCPTEEITLISNNRVIVDASTQYENYKFIGKSIDTLLPFIEDSMQGAMYRHIRLRWEWQNLAEFYRSVACFASWKLIVVAKRSGFKYYVLHTSRDDIITIYTTKKICKSNKMKTLREACRQFWFKMLEKHYGGILLR